MKLASSEARNSAAFATSHAVPWGSVGRLGRSDLDGGMDGQGMGATQSHAMSFDDFPASRIAWPGQLSQLQQATAGLTQCCFTAVIAGVAEITIETAREQVARRRDGMRGFERLKWTRAELEFWLIQQAYERMLRAMEEGQDSRLRAVQAKTAIAELAESVLHRICRVIGGGTFSRSSPFGHWFEDVRALGFLRRPPLRERKRPPDGARRALHCANWPTATIAALPPCAARRVRRTPRHPRQPRRSTHCW